MKVSTFTALTASAAQLVSGHYIFDKLILPGGQVSKGWEYIREHKQNPIYMPIRGGESINALDMRCNKGAYAPNAKTKTLPIKAGDQVGFKMGLGATMKHPGPMAIYLSKAPSTAATYDASGDWFKIYEEGVCGNLASGLQDQMWCTWDKDTVTFTIPPQTPAGEYLLRLQHSAIHGAHAGAPEFYVSCAQVKIEGTGTGTPAPVTKIPGELTLKSPGIDYSIYGHRPFYPMPGIAVWKGGNTGVVSKGNATPAVGGAAAAAGSASGGGAASAIPMAKSPTTMDKVASPPPSAPTTAPSSSTAYPQTPSAPVAKGTSPKGLSANVGSSDVQSMLMQILKELKAAYPELFQNL